jgi:hypothetical protein
VVVVEDVLPVTSLLALSDLGELAFVSLCSFVVVGFVPASLAALFPLSDLVPDFEVVVVDVVVDFDASPLLMSLFAASPLVAGAVVVVVVVDSDFFASLAPCAAATPAVVANASAIVVVSSLFMMSPEVV